MLRAPPKQLKSKRQVRRFTQCTRINTVHTFT
jgi:hypothetical protein